MHVLLFCPKIQKQLYMKWSGQSLIAPFAMETWFNSVPKYAGLVSSDWMLSQSMPIEFCPKVCRLVSAGGGEGSASGPQGELWRWPEEDAALESPWWWGHDLRGTASTSAGGAVRSDCQGQEGRVPCHHRHEGQSKERSTPSWNPRIWFLGML